MNRKIICAVLLCVGSMNVLSAAPLVKNMLHPNALNNKAHRVASDSPYTDFTGTWVSNRCMGTEVSLSIENSEEFIDIGGEQMTIGSMSTTSKSGTRSFMSTTAASDVVAVEWNKDKTQLVFKVISIEKAFADAEAGDAEVDTGMHLTMNHMTMQLTNGKLMLQMGIAEYIDLQRIDSSKPNCIFNKIEG
jgi:hypothetical protein